MAIQDNEELTEAQRRYIMALPPSNPISGMLVFSHIVGLGTIWALYCLFQNPEAEEYVKNLVSFGVPLVVFVQFLSCAYMFLLTGMIADPDYNKESRALAAALRGEWQVRAVDVIGFVEDLVFVALAVMVGYVWWPLAMLFFMGAARVQLVFIHSGIVKAIKRYDPDAVAESNGHVPEDGITTGNIWRSN